MASQKCFLGLLVNLNSWPQNPCYGPGFWLFPLPPLFFSQTLLTEENSIFAWALPQPMSWAFKTLRIGYIYIYISKTPTCWWQWWGSTGGHFRHSVSVWCGTDSTGDVVVWQEETTIQKRKWKKINKKKRETTHQTTDVCWGVTLLVTSAVMWSGTGQGAQPGLPVADVTWYEARKTHWRGGWLDQSPLFILAILFLFISPSHTCTHTNIRSLPHSLLSSSLCQSYLSYHAATHFPSLLNSFLSIQYSPLSHFLSRSCSISLSPQWAVSLSRSAEQRAWVRLQTSLQWIDKNRALVTAAGWRGGKEREEIEIRESKRGKKGAEIQDGMKIEGWRGSLRE